MNKAKIEQAIKLIQEAINENELIGLEDHNFKVDSEGWTKAIMSGIPMLENPAKDIWEFLDGKLSGEQLFTWDAAIRETQKAGKRMPTKEEWVAISKDIILEMPMVGYRLNSSAVLYYQGSYGRYWSSSPYGTNAYSLSFYASSVNPASNYYRAYGFSVRCVKELTNQSNTK